MSPRRADPSVADIEARAAACADLASLATAARSCTACAEFAATRTTVVVGDTPANPRLLIVGEAPGANEDLAGRPFVGRGGELLDTLLAEVGLSRTGLAVLNVVKCRPPANRTPTRAEATRCTGWLDRQVALIDPPLVLTLGRTALTWALGAAVTLDAVRGKVHRWRGRRLVASYHPSAALRFGPRGAPRQALESDLRVVAEAVRCG
ncbi:MAG TPA: uracil-DNA glycosylase [Mycobacteriales bacterium]|nr:uracil-DNA glycosylase [Mycobacteriales bacterium]